jgi:hypothetical protein
MATRFRRFPLRAIGQAPAAFPAVPAAMVWKVVALTVCNVFTDATNTTVDVYDGANATRWAYLVPVPLGSSFAVDGAIGHVCLPGDIIRVTMGAAASGEAYLSVMERDQP